MALKKWVFGTKLSQQITEQNANWDIVDKHLSGGGYITPTFSAGVASTQANNLVIYKSSEGVVSIVGAVDVSTNISNNGVLFTIPSTASPSTEFFFFINFSGKEYQLNIKETGQVKIINRSLVAGDRVYVTVTFKAK